MDGLWTRGYFLRQGTKVGPGCVAALTRLLDSKVIEAQGFRSCMNILDLGRRGNRHLLEQACQQLIADPLRQISYTAVKHRLSMLRAQSDQRPTTADAGASSHSPTAAAAATSVARDTSRAHLAGAGAFSLDALTRTRAHTDAQNKTGGGQRA